jgi:hypothetical protein
MTAGLGFCYSICVPVQQFFLNNCHYKDLHVIAAQQFGAVNNPFLPLEAA